MFKKHSIQYLLATHKSLTMTSNHPISLLRSHQLPHHHQWKTLLHLHLTSLFSLQKTFFQPEVTVTVVVATLVRMLVLTLVQTMMASIPLLSQRQFKHTCPAHTHSLPHLTTKVTDTMPRPLPCKITPTREPRNHLTMNQTREEATNMRESRRRRNTSTIDLKETTKTSLTIILLPQTL